VDDTWHSLALQYQHKQQSEYSTPESLPGPLWYPLQSINEPFAGAWQRNISARPQSIATFPAVFASITRIAQDVAKVGWRLMERDQNGIWAEASSPTFSPVLEQPNDFQGPIEFLESWVTSKLTHGNTYVLKERDGRGTGPTQGAVRALYVLDAARTRPLVADDGSIFYQTSRDNLAGVGEDNLVIPASEIIHDVMVPFFHPLCGVSPLVAAALTASTGNLIQKNSAAFFANQSRPSGILVAPGRIAEEDAKRLKAHWEQHYAGENAGRIAVVGDGLEYKTMGTNAVDAQLLEQLKYSAEQVAMCFGLPAHKIGAGEMPNLSNIEALDQQYYSQCLQPYFSKIQWLMSNGLGLRNVQGRTYAVMFDLDDLLRMDTATLMKALSDGVRAGVLAPNEGRRRIGYRPVPGGDSPYLQHQDYSLAALAKRDSKPDPFASEAPKAPSTPPPADPPPTKSADLLDLDVEMLAQLVTLEANTQLRLLTAA
jgi:HK97 family phage portal protein